MWTNRKLQRISVQLVGNAESRRIGKRVLGLNDNKFEVAGRVQLEQKLRLLPAIVFERNFISREGILISHNPCVTVLTFGLRQPDSLYVGLVGGLRRIGGHAEP